MIETRIQRSLCHLDVLMEIKLHDLSVQQYRWIALSSSVIKVSGDQTQVQCKQTWPTWTEQCG